MRRVDDYLRCSGPCGSTLHSARIDRCSHCKRLFCGPCKARHLGDVAHWDQGSLEVRRRSNAKLRAKRKQGHHGP